MIEIHLVTLTCGPDAVILSLGSRPLRVTSSLSLFQISRSLWGGCPLIIKDVPKPHHQCPQTLKICIWTPILGHNQDSCGKSSIQSQLPVLWLYETFHDECLSQAQPDSSCRPIHPSVSQQFSGTGDTLALRLQSTSGLSLPLPWGRLMQAHKLRHLLSPVSPRNLGLCNISLVFLGSI